MAEGVTGWESPDSTGDPLLLFESEASFAAPTYPAPIRKSAPGAGTPTAVQPRVGRIRLWSVSAASILLGLLIGFAGGYRVARPVSPGPAPSPSAETTRQPAVTAQPVSDADAREDSSLPGLDEHPVAATSVPPVTTRLGSIEVLSRPSGAQVVLDGQVVGQTPMVIRGIDEGTHQVGLEVPGFNRWVTSVHVTGGAQTRVAGSLEGSPPQ